MKIAYHPGTGTVIDASEVLIFDTRDLQGEGYDTIEETLQSVDVSGIDLGELLDAIARLNFINHGVLISQFEKKGN
jgi:hypothetical protein